MRILLCTVCLLAVLAVATGCPRHKTHTTEIIETQQERVISTEPVIE